MQIVSNLISNLLLLLERKYGVTLRRNEESRALRKKADKEVEKVKKYLDENYALNINVQSLGEVAYYSPQYLFKQFKKSEGTSPMQYLKKVRVYRGADMLCSGDYSVKRGATMVGYTDAQAFRTEYKQTPLQGKAFAKEKLFQ